MSRILIGLVATVLAACSVGCGVNSDKYTRDVEALKAHNEALERRNRELEAMEKAYKEMAENYKVSMSQDEMYAEIAKELAEALKGFKNAAGDDVTIDAKTGKVTFATDVLFDSGSFTITPKGQEIVKKFAATMKGQAVRFRVIGHTDNTKIVRASTKDKLDTDTNLELSFRRALAVSAALMKLDIRENRFMQVIGMGSMMPAATQAKSRRVEIFLVKEDVKSSSAQK